MDIMIKDVDRNILAEVRAVQNRWREYHEQLLNFEDERVAELTDAKPYGIDENWRIQMKVNLVDVRMAVKKLKKGKVSGVHWWRR